MLERRDFLLAERGADRDREMASGIQHNAAALVARLQATGTSGVRAALGGSPVAYGSLRAAKGILTRRDCDVNSLTRRGTKSRSGQYRVSVTGVGVAVVCAFDLRATVLCLLSFPIGNNLPNDYNTRQYYSQVYCLLIYTRA